METQPSCACAQSKTFVGDNYSNFEYTPQDAPDSNFTTPYARTGGGGAHLSSKTMTR
jgi:hypothetical protein